MALEELDQFFGGVKGAAAKARKAMHKTYGPEDGEHVFRAKIAKERRGSGGKGKAPRRPPPPSRSKRKTIAERLLG
jgi:hypothetical protein